jgi:hypothetical protein
MRGIGGLALLVIVVGTILRYWYVFAAVVGVVLALGALWWWLDARALRRQAAADELTAIAHRADQQHAWTLAGDDRGIYGDYAPKQFD